MKASLTLILSFFLFSLFAQNTFNYRFDFDLPTPSILTSIEVTDSCYYVCGGTLDTIWPNRPGSLFAKINLNGEVMWQKLLSDTTISHITSKNTLIPTFDGNFIVTGVFSDTSSSGSLLIKYTPEGDTIFTRRYLSPYAPANPFTSIPNILITPDSGFLLVNNIQNPVNATDIYVIKTDSLGNIEWDEIYGNFGVSEISYNLKKGHNNYVICGSQGNTNLTPNDYESMTYLMNIDSTGAVQWQYLSDENELQFAASDMLPTTDGGYVIASGKGIEFISGPNSMLLWHPYIYKLDANRNFVWGVDIRDTIPSPDNIFNKIVAPSDGSGFVAVGTIFEFTGGGGYNINGIISKVSIEGDSLWTRYYNYVDSPADTHAFYDIEETSDGGFIMVGQATDHYLGGESPLQRAWLVKLDQHGCLVPGCHIIDDVGEPIAEIKLDLFPNPTSDFLNIFYYDPNHRGKVDFRIVDVQGRELQSFSSEGNNITHIISLDKYPDGQYFLTVDNGKDVVSKPFLVVR